MIGNAKLKMSVDICRSECFIGHDPEIMAANAFSKDFKASLSICDNLNLEFLVHHFYC